VKFVNRNFPVTFSYFYSGLDVINEGGISYETVEIPKPLAPFITLEILSRERN
jgi:hypothetical protein